MNGVSQDPKDVGLEPKSTASGSDLGVDATSWVVSGIPMAASPPCSPGQD